MIRNFYNTENNYWVPRDINLNGHDYVDLGLPSGTLWATMNVGAELPMDEGLYFQWGDVQGYTKDQIKTVKGKKKFAPDWSDYNWRNGNIFTKYDVAGATLGLKDDAAHVHMGGDWHMPTPDQINELINCTTSEWRRWHLGANGRLFISKKDNSKFIFIPASGYAWNGSVHDIGDSGFVWSSMLNGNYVDYGQSLDFNPTYLYRFGDFNRYYGFSVRGVIG